MAEQIDLTGKVAVVTGAGSGIGRATARLLARRGATLHIADVHADTVAAVAYEISGAGGDATAHTLDVSRPDDVEAFAGAVFAADGRVDILHNNAGVGHAGDIEATTVEDWQRVIGVNLLGVAYGIQAFVPRMLAQGRPAVIVNTASMAGLFPTAKMAPYCASKFGVVGMSETLDAELRSRGIRVVAVCPGVIDTGIVRATTMRGELAADRDKLVALYANRGTSPDVVAAAVLDGIVRPRPIIVSPRWQVLGPYLLHRLSPRLTQPLASGLTKLANLVPAKTRP
ncbi:MAG TPA: SDR family NAD(P)-dependent oxidoreductase [Mycobacterium sp.]|nr:SDR family NAD(P)-dependent oxidoreductase [Mycobacterium sp.]